MTTTKTTFAECHQLMATYRAAKKAANDALDGYSEMYSQEKRDFAHECLTAASTAHKAAKVALFELDGPGDMDEDEFYNALDAWALELA